MNDKIIIAIIVVIVLYAHWWIFQWVRFKVDETVILKYLQKADKKTENVNSIGNAINLSERRVAKVLAKSIRLNEFI